MSSRVATILAVLAGVATATLALAAVVAFAPGPQRGAAASPTGSAASPAASPGVSASSSPLPSASAAPTASASAGPSDSDGGIAASPGASGSLFGVGRPAPGLRVLGLDGGTIDLAALRGHPVWVNFMQTTCPPCRDEFPLMNGFLARYGGSTGLVILAVDIREDQAAVKAFATSLKATFSLALDPDGTAQRAWGALALPVHFWVDRDGIVRDGALGGIGPDIMAAGLRKILPGVDVTP